MKKILFTGVAALALSLATTRAELLLNGTFEGPGLLTTGDHTTLPVQPNNWSVATSTTAAGNASLSNLVRGTITGSGTTTSLAPYPGDSANGDIQSLDGAGQNVFVYQDFVMTLTSRVNVQIAFGGRDSNSATGTGSTWQILDPANGYAVVTSLGSTINPATGVWVPSSVTPTAVLTAGKTYRFAISLGDPSMVDAASINPVPEPSTFAWVALGAGLACLLRSKFAARRRMSNH